MSSTWPVCVRKSLESIKEFEGVALNMDTNENQNLEPLLSAADFSFCLGTRMFLCTVVSTSRQMLQK